jgi:DNA processing protein
LDWRLLIRAPRLGTAGALRLLQHCGSAAGFTSDLPPDLDLKPETHAWLKAPDPAAAEQDLAWMQKTGTQLLSFTDAEYTPLLKQIADPPIALFVRGDASLLSEPQLAMVGSRNPSVEGRRNAEEFAEYLARCGLVITNGVALGIDAAEARRIRRRHTRGTGPVAGADGRAAAGSRSRGRQHGRATAGSGIRITVEFARLRPHLGGQSGRANWFDA